MWLIWVGVIVNCFFFFWNFYKLDLNNEVELSDMYILGDYRKKESWLGNWNEFYFLVVGV